MQLPCEMWEHISANLAYKGKNLFADLTAIAFTYDGFCPHEPGLHHVGLPANWHIMAEDDYITYADHCSRPRVVLVNGEYMPIPLPGILAVTILTFYHTGNEVIPTENGYYVKASIYNGWGRIVKTVGRELPSSATKVEVWCHLHYLTAKLERWLDTQLGNWRSHTTHWDSSPA